MHVCDDGHDEIVYTDSNCPLCKAMKEIDLLNETISDNKYDIETLKDDIDSRDKEIEILEEDIRSLKEI